MVIKWSTSKGFSIWRLRVQISLQPVNFPHMAAPCWSIGPSWKSCTLWSYLWMNWMIKDKTEEGIWRTGPWMENRRHHKPESLEAISQWTLTWNNLICIIWLWLINGSCIDWGEIFQLFLFEKAGTNWQPVKVIYFSDRTSSIWKQIIVSLLILVWLDATNKKQ